MGCVKKSVSVSVPQLSVDLPELRACITNAFAHIDRNMLHRAWDELDYKVDVCRVTRGAHIELQQHVEKT